MDGKELLKNAAENIKKNSPSIFTCLSVIGAVSAVVMAIKATPKALDQITQIREEKCCHALKKAESEGKTLTEEEIDVICKLKPSDYFKACWKTYTPTFLMLVTCITSAVASNVISEKRNSVLAAALGISQETLREYHKKMTEEIGKNKAEKIRDEVAKSKVKIPYTGAYNPDANPNEQLFYDNFSGRYFTSSMPKLRMAEANFNNYINDELFANINYFYDLVNNEKLTHIAAGKLGYHIGNKINIRYVASIQEDTGIPYIILDYGEDAKDEYNK